MEALDSSKTNRRSIASQTSLIYVSTPVASTNVANTTEVTLRLPVLSGHSVAYITVYVSVWVGLARSQCAPNRNEIERYPLLSYNCKMIVVEVETRSFFRNIIWIFEDLQIWTPVCHKHNTIECAVSTTAFHLSSFSEPLRLAHLPFVHGTHRCTNGDQLAMHVSLTLRTEQGTNSFSA